MPVRMLVQQSSALFIRIALWELTCSSDYNTVRRQGVWQRHCHLSGPIFWSFRPKTKISQQNFGRALVRSRSKVLADMCINMCKDMRIDLHGQILLRMWHAPLDSSRRDSQKRKPTRLYMRSNHAVGDAAVAIVLARQNLQMQTSWQMCMKCRLARDAKY